MWSKNHVRTRLLFLLYCLVILKLGSGFRPGGGAFLSEMHRPSLRHLSSTTGYFSRTSTIQAVAGDDGILNDLQDTSARPKFKSYENEDGSGGEDGDYKTRAAAKRRARRSNINERLLNEIAEIEQARPTRESDLPEDVVAPLLGYKEDLDGVNPFFALFGSALVGSASYGMWALTQWLATAFAEHPLSADTFYVVQRIATIVRTCVVGGAALGAGIFGLTGFGLFLMATRVGVGVATGELDMTKRSDTQIDKQFQAIKDLMDK